MEFISERHNKKMMRVTLPVLVLFVLGLSLLSITKASAQKADKSKFIVSGKILDSTNSKPVPYATITAVKADSAIASTYANEEGLFTLELDKGGKYSIEVSFIGYELHLVDITLAEDRSSVSMGNVLLTKSSKSLQEITVTGRRKLIELRPGMLVYNAENDLSLKGGTAADVLRKAPVLNVDAQGNVSMRGSSNLKILIDGKYSGQIARSPADALNMMPANIIKSVEVITTPSAKYDAEGAAGVINIITKKGKQSISGALELAGSNFEQVFNPRITIAQNKWNISVHGHLHRLRQKSAYAANRTQYENGSPSLILKQEMTKDNYAPHGSADVAVTYAADSTTELSFGANIWFGNWPNNNNLLTSLLQPNGAVIEQYNQYTDAKDKYAGTDMNLGYSKKFKKPGQELNILAQFSPGSNREPYDLLQYNNHNARLYQEVNNNSTKKKEWTLQVDYLQPLGSKSVFSLESGLKMILRNVKNRYNVLAAQNQDALEPVADRSDVFTYNQDVWAAYSMLKANLKKNWYAEAGLRLEQTVFNGNLEQSATNFKNDFTNLIPSATISKKVNDNQTFSLSYTQRLTRPYIWDLNPNINASDPKNLSSGNPYLKPEIAHQAEFTYGFYPTSKFFLNTALFWKQTNNAIVEYTSVNNAGVSTTNKQNLATNKIYGANISAMLTLTSWWSANSNLNLEYLDFNSDALHILSKGWATHINLNSTFKLPSNYSLQAFGEYNTREVTLQGYKSNRYYYNLAAKKEIPSKKITITLSLTNPFSNYITQTEVIQTSSFYYAINNRYYNRAFKLILNWEFGGLINQKKTKRISNDDVNDQSKG